MELFDIVLYPIAELFKLIMSSQLEEALGFSLPTFMIGIFIASAFITTITGTISATQNLLGHSTPEAQDYPDIQLKTYPSDAPQIGETRYLE